MPTTSSRSGLVVAAMLLTLLGGTTITAAADLNLTKARLRFNTTSQGDKSSIRAQGYFFTDPPTDTFNPLAGFSVRTQDGVALDRTVVFAGADCFAIPGKTKCKSVDRSLQATFKQLPSEPNVFQFSLVLRRLGLMGPFNGPVTLTLSETGSGVDRTDTMNDCVLKITGLSCREF